MLKKSLIVMSVGATFYLHAQDISALRNSIDVYSNTQNVGSSKFNAMAGSIGALGGDATSLLSNPAGLGVAIASDFSATLSISDNKNTSSLAGSSIGYNKTNVRLGNVNGIAVFKMSNKTPWKFVNVGANISTQSIENYVETPGNSNISISKNLIDPSGNPVTGNISYLGHAYNRYGNLTKFNLGVGANYNNSLYLGASINIHDANIDQYDTAALGLNLDNSVDTFSKQYTPYSEQSSGFSASFGVIGKVNNQVRLGATIETPTWWSIDRVYANYYDGTDGIYYQNYGESRNFRSPMKATISGAYVPTKNFSLNVDYTLGLTKPSYRVQGPAESEFNNFYDNFSKNLSEIKVGAEYRIKALRIRGGYSYTASPFDAMTINAYTNSGSQANINYSNLILGSRDTFGVGLGYDFGGFYIDATYQNISSKYKNPFLAGYSDYGTGYYSGNYDVANPTSVVSDVKNVKNNYFFTVGWKF